MTSTRSLSNARGACVRASALGTSRSTPVRGAPLKRFLQRQLETKLARARNSGKIHEGSTVTFQVKNDELVLAGASVHA